VGRNHRHVWLPKTPPNDSVIITGILGWSIINRTGRKVVKTSVFLADLADGPVVNAVYRKYFPDLPPTRSVVQGAGLARGARVEIECLAFVE
jgi:enamine deaminase RidA (YjgF/YER057c/UK114 family)